MASLTPSQKAAIAKLPQEMRKAATDNPASIPQLQNAAALAKSTGSGTTTQHHVGVPDSYVPGPHVTPGHPQGRHYTSTQDGSLQDIKVRYQTGFPKEWAVIASLPPEKLRSLQIGLVQSGILKYGSFAPGAPDVNTKKAISKLLGEANATGMRWSDYLDERIAQSQKDGFSPSQAAQRAPLSIQLSNPDTIKSQVTNDATNLLGSSAAAGDPQHYVDEIHNQQIAQQTTDYNAGLVPKTVSTDPATTDALIMKEHPTDYKVAQLGEHGQAILNSLIQTTPGGNG